MLGVINVLKPTGWTSSDVVVRVKRLVREKTGDKSIKVGHLGTLDPAGSGVLPIVIGRATRLFDYYVSCDKLYRATFTFGKTTDTLDSYGKLTDTSNVIPSRLDIENVLNSFIGEIAQVPPQYSRISVGGARACDIARSGKEVDIKPRNVVVYSIDILNYENGILLLDIRCSGGTYIRSICRDLATKLNTVAYMSSIIRLENKGMMIEDSVTLSELEEDIEKSIISLEDMLKDMQKVKLNSFEANRILNGLTIKSRKINGDYVIIIDDKVFAIARDENNIVKVIIRLWQ